MCHVSAGRTVGRATVWLTACLCAAGALAETPAAPPADDPLPAGAVARFGRLRLNHCGRVGDLAFSPDGRLLASCSYRCDAGDMALWDVDTGRLVRRLAARYTPWTAAFLAGDEVLASATGRGREIRMWETATGTEAGALACRGFPVTASPDGRTLAVTDGAGLHVVDAMRDKTVCTIPKRSGGAFSPDGKLLATRPGTSDGGPELREPATGKLVRTLDSVGQRLLTPVFSPDGRLLAAFSYSPGAAPVPVVWDVGSGKVLRQLPSEGSCRELAFSRDSRLLAGVGTEPGVCLWDVRTGKKPRVLPVPQGRLMAVAFSPDGEWLAAAGWSGQIHMWETGTWKQRGGVAGHVGPVLAAAASPDGSGVLTGGQDGTVRWWDARTGLPRLCLRGGEQGIAVVAVSDDSRTLAAVVTDDTVGLWDAETGAMRRPVRAPGGAILRIDLPPGGKELTAFGADGAVWRIDLDSGSARPVRAAGKSARPVSALSADGSAAASVERNVCRVWEPCALGEVATFAVAGTSRLYGVAIGPAGRLLAGDARTKLMLVEIDSGRTACGIVLSGSRRADNRAMAFSPDGQVLAAAEEGAGIGLWSVRTGQAIGRLQGHQGKVNSLRFAARGKRLLSAASDGTAILWDLAGLDDKAGAADGGPANAEQLGRLWEELASTDAPTAHEAAFRLIDAGRPAVAMLAGKLRPAAGPDDRDVRRYVDDLGHSRYAVRERATEALRRLGPAVEPALRLAARDTRSEEVRARARSLLAVLDRPPERTGQALRLLRAVHVLERIGSAEARGVLRRLVRGSPHATLTRRAAGALARTKGGGE